MADPFSRFNGIFFEKSRLAIVALLYRDGYAAFTTLRERIEASDGAAYAHLERLIEGGYLEKRKEVAGMKAQTVYRLTKQGQEEFEAYLAAVEELLLASSRKGEST
ncbi:MAG TPA: transcriptional regulator [Rectinemataceae bacterium]|nr:transcriptional regulator [Rectinemataceae bacterium]